MKRLIDCFQGPPYNVGDKIVCSFSHASLNKSSNNHIPLVDNENKTVDFDYVTRSFCRQLKTKKNGLCKSVDSIHFFQNNETLYFIEFKSGDIDPGELSDTERKIYTSLLILIEVGIFHNISDARKRLCVVLVLDKTKIKRKITVNGLEVYNEQEECTISDQLSNLGESIEAKKILLDFFGYFRSTLCKEIYALHYQDFNRFVNSNGE